MSDSERTPFLPLMRFFRNALGALPLSVRALLGRFLGTVFWLVPTRDRKIAILQLSWRIPDIPALQTSRRLYANLGQTIMEGLNLTPYLKRMDQFITIEGEGYLKQAKADSDRPAIFLSAHVSNWDLLAAIGISHGLDLHTIGVEARSAVLHTLLEDIRSSYGGKTLWRKSGSSREIIRTLKENKSIAALIDQDTSVESTFSSFFGVPARTPSTLIKLAKKYNAHLFSAFIVRTSLLQYRVVFQPLPPEKAVEEVLNTYHAHLEQIVREHPDQWVWLHKRWRSLPQGERMSSSEYVRYLLHQGRESS